MLSLERLIYDGGDTMAEEQPAQKPPQQPEPEPKPAPQPAAEPAQQAQQPAASGPKKAPFILSIIGGILILVTGVMFAALGSMMSGMGLDMASLMGATAGDAEAAAAAASMMMTVYAAGGIALGVLVIVGAVLMRNPARAKMGSILVLVCSILSIFAGGGFFVGMILGIIGGALGLKG
jgi:hypothetical protein